MTKAKAAPTPGISFDDLTIGETRYLEKSTGLPLQKIGELMADGDASVLPMMEAFAFIMLRRTGITKPTPAQIDDVTMRQVMAFFDFDEVADADPE